MDKKMADDILTTLNESAFVIDKTLGEIKPSCPDESFRVCAKLLGTIMADMFDSIMAPIYDELTELAPDWYRDGPPRERSDMPALKLEAAIQSQLVAAFDVAYEKVQLLLGQISTIGDPREVAMVRRGLHQISAAICHAHMAVLSA